jgi:hypothetical protein
MWFRVMSEMNKITQNTETFHFPVWGLNILQYLITVFYIQEKVVETYSLSKAGVKKFPKARIYVKILGARRVTCNMFHTEEPQILGATV